MVPVFWMPSWQSKSICGNFGIDSNSVLFKMITFVKGILRSLGESMNEIVTFAESLTPLIKELRHTTESDRRIAAPIVEAIRNSDLCRLLLDTGVPPRYT